MIKKKWLHKEPKLRVKKRHTKNRNSKYDFQSKSYQWKCFSQFVYDWIIACAAHDCLISFGKVVGKILNHVKYVLGFIPPPSFFFLHYLPHLFIQIYYRGAHLAFPAAHSCELLPKPHCFTPRNAICSNIFSPFFFCWRKVTDTLVHIRLYLFIYFYEKWMVRLDLIPIIQVEHTKSKVLEVQYICMATLSPSIVLSVLPT